MSSTYAEPRGGQLSSRPSRRRSGLLGLAAVLAGGAAMAIYLTPAAAPTAPLARPVLADTVPFDEQRATAARGALVLADVVPFEEYDRIDLPAAPALLDVVPFDEQRPSAAPSDAVLADLEPFDELR
jgi:hypothetical protein